MCNDRDAFACKSGRVRQGGGNIDQIGIALHSDGADLAKKCIEYPVLACKRAGMGRGGAGTGFRSADFI